MSYKYTRVDIIYTPGDFEKNLVTVRVQSNIDIEDDSNLCHECNENEITHSPQNLCDQCFNELFKELK